MSDDVSTIDYFQMEYPSMILADVQAYGGAVIHVVAILVVGMLYAIGPKGKK